MLSSKFRKFCGSNKYEFEKEKLAKVWDHIFYGTFGKRRTLSGVHHAEGGVMPGGVFIEPIFGQRKMEFYKARIYRVGATGGLRRKTSNPGGVSTMFPDTWSQNQVKAVATSAYIKYKSTGNSAVPLESILGSKYKGITIRVMMDGKTPSIYPEF
ncbi:MAG: EndoU domain-containing protein [Candidatus Thiodiazotropha sp.]